VTQRTGRFLIKYMNVRATMRQPNFLQATVIKDKKIFVSCIRKLPISLRKKKKKGE